jgi:hypothetical protein
MAKFLKLQTQTALAQRKLPMIDKLYKAEEFPVWRDKLIRVLKRHDLDKYILTDMEEPEGDDEKQQWKTDRADIDDYIQSVVPGNKVWMILRGMGWDAQAMDPRETYLKLVQYFEKGSADSEVKMLQEFASIRRESFDKMENFQMRVNFLKERLDKSVFKMEEPAYTWLAMKGIMTAYPDLYSRCVTNIQTGIIDWGDLMAELQELAVTEAAQPAMSSVKFNTKDKKNTDNNNTPTNTSADSKSGDPPTTGRSRERENCKICNRNVWKGSKHCKGCNAHHQSDDCWKCNPGKAPEWWLKKTSESSSSTTGPLHQQSGVANPPGPAKPANVNPSNLLFTTNHGNDDDHNVNMVAINPDFHQGPWNC